MTPADGLSIGVAFLAAVIAYYSFRIARGSLETANKSLATAERALAAQHLPNISTALILEPHAGKNEGHMHLHIRNLGDIRANDLVARFTVSHGAEKRAFRLAHEVLEPGEEWKTCFQKDFISRALQVASDSLEPDGDTRAKLRLEVRAPELAIVCQVTWQSGAFGLAPVEIKQQWVVTPADFSDNRVAGNWLLDLKEDQVSRVQKE